MKEACKHIPTLLFPFPKQDWDLAMGRDGGSCAKEHLRDAPSHLQAGTGWGDLLEGEYHGLSWQYLLSQVQAAPSTWESLGSSETGSVSLKKSVYPSLLILRYIPFHRKKEHKIQLNIEVIRMLTKNRNTLGKKYFHFSFQLSFQ